MKNKEIDDVIIMILSIDVGIKNLAMCVITTDKKIRYWDVSGVPPMHADGLFPCMKRHLDERSVHFEPIQTVLIERQPDKNRGIKSVEHFIHAYFLIHDKNVILWDARHKIPDIVGPGRTQYSLRKKASVERCREFLKLTNTEFLPFFETSKKKDDLADTVMQALSYMEKKPDEDKTPKPRKPTLNQTETKYSKANLAYLYKLGLTNNPRFKKDLARYYSDVSELAKEFNIVK
jgi:hypothetical protein